VRKFAGHDGEKRPVGAPAINCRIPVPLHYKSLIPPPARGKAEIPIFNVMPGGISIQALEIFE